MKSKWFVFILGCFLFLNLPLSIAQDVIFIKGGDVDGIKVGSFYLFADVITNQDYFVFIQMDGYKKTSLWDPEALKNLNRFKNEQGDFAPRSWKGSSPPVGQEFQPVLGISIQEAIAYAKSLGYLVPSPKMWQLAQQVKGDIGPYPWKDDGDNFNAIRMAAYYAPANIWENRFSKVQQEMDTIQKTSAKISSVNLNSSNIQNLERKLRTVTDDMKSLESAIEKKLSDEVGKQVSQLAARMTTIEKKAEEMSKTQQEVLTSRLAQIESRIAQLGGMEKEVARISQTLESSQKEMNDRVLAMENKLGEEIKKLFEQKAKESDEKLKEWEKKFKEMENFNEQIQGTIKQLAQMKEQYKSLETSFNSLKSAQTAFGEQQKEFEKKQNQKLQEGISGIESKIARLDKMESTLQECGEKIKQLFLLCPVIPDGSSYLQIFMTLKEQHSVIKDHLSKQTKDLSDTKDGFEKALATLRNQSFVLTSKVTGMGSLVDEMKSSVNGLRENASNVNSEIQSLKKQDSIFDKETISNREMINSTLKRVEKTEKDTNQLFQQSAQMENKGKELDSQIQELKKMDGELARKNTNVDTEIANLKETLAQQDKRDVKFDEEVKSLKGVSAENGKKLTAVGATIDGLRKKQQEFGEAVTSVENKFKEKSNEFKEEIDKVRKQMDKDFKEELNKISKKADTNYVSIVALEKQMESRKISLENSVNIMTNRIQKLESDQMDTVRQISTSATEMRRGMMEIGEKIRSLFQNDMMFGPIPSKESPTAPARPGEKGKEEEKKKVLEEFKGLVIKEIKGEFDKDFSKVREEMEKTKGELLKSQEMIKENIQKGPSADRDHELSELCYRMGKIFYNYSYRPISFECIKLARKFGHKEADNFYHEFWGDLNCPKEMVHIQVQEYLFNVTAGYQKELDRLNISVGLQEKFAENQNSLSASATVRVQKPGIQWIIVDNENRQYLVSKKKEHLLVYRRGNAKIGNANDPEFALKQVRLEDFYIDRHEVTRKEYNEFIKSGGYKDERNWSQEGIDWRKVVEAERGKFSEPFGWTEPSAEEESLPVTNVNFYEAQAYAKWKGKRLPTPEEWEYAARGTDLRNFPWGNAHPKSGPHFKANYNQLEGNFDRYQNVAPVSLFKWDLSPFGVIGMAGNVSEWCEGQYKVPDSERTLQMIKGGSFNHQWFQLQVFTGTGREASDSFDYIGFRCVQDVPKNQ